MPRPTDAKSVKIRTNQEHLLMIPQKQSSTGEATLATRSSSLWAPSSLRSGMWRPLWVADTEEVTAAR